MASKINLSSVPTTNEQLELRTHSYLVSGSVFNDLSKRLVRRSQITLEDADALQNHIDLIKKTILELPEEWVPLSEAFHDARGLLSPNIETARKQLKSGGLTHIKCAPPEFCGLLSSTLPDGDVSHVTTDDPIVELGVAIPPSSLCSIPDLFLDYRYHFLRASYLSYISRFLGKIEGATLSVFRPSIIDKPLLDVFVGKFTVRIVPILMLTEISVPDDAIKGSMKSSPSISISQLRQTGNKAPLNLRDKFFQAEAQCRLYGNIAKMYTCSIAADIILPHFCSYITEAFTEMPSLWYAYVMLKVFLKKRDLYGAAVGGLSSLHIGCLLASLLRSRKFDVSSDSLTVFRSALSVFASGLATNLAGVPELAPEFSDLAGSMPGPKASLTQPDFSTEPRPLAADWIPSMYSKSTGWDLLSPISTFSPLSPSASLAFLPALAHSCLRVLTGGVLTSTDDAAPFRMAFKDDVATTAMADSIVTVSLSQYKDPTLGLIKEQFLRPTPQFSGLFDLYVAGPVAVACTKLRQHIIQALGSRIQALCVRPLADYSITQTKLGKKPKEDSVTLLISACLTREAYIPLIKGPATAEEMATGANIRDTVGRVASAQAKAEVDSFCELWGTSAEMREFSDGTIRWCAFYPSTAQSMIPGQMLTHLAHMALGVPASDIRSEPSFSAFYSLPDDAALESTYQLLMSAINNMPDLPLNVVDLAPAHSAFRGTHCFPPETPDMDRDLHTTFCEPLDIVLRFSDSETWPDDPTHLAALRTLVADKLREGLTKAGFEAVNRGSCVDVATPKSHIFRIWIYANGEVRSLGQEEPERAAVLARDLVALPILHSRLSGLVKENSLAMKEGAALVKRWLSSHMFTIMPLLSGIERLYAQLPALSGRPDSPENSEYEKYFRRGAQLSDEMVELIVASLFCGGSAFPWAPTSPFSTFERALRFLSAFRWDLSALVVDLGGLLTDQDRAEAAVKFSERLSNVTASRLYSLPATIVTPGDTSGTRWTTDCTQELMAEVSQVAKVCVPAIASIRACAPSYEAVSQAPSLGSLFRTPIAQRFHALLHIAPYYVPRAEREIVGVFDTTKAGNARLPYSPLESGNTIFDPPQEKNLARIGRARLFPVGFDPVTSLIQELSTHFGHLAAFYRDMLDGTMIGVKFLPRANINKETRRRVTQLIDFVPSPAVLDESGSGVIGHVSSRVLLAEMFAMGGSILEHVTYLPLLPPEIDFVMTDSSQPKKSKKKHSKSGSK